MRNAENSQNLRIPVPRKSFSPREKVPKADEGGGTGWEVFEEQCRKPMISNETATSNLRTTFP